MTKWLSDYEGEMYYINSYENYDYLRAYMVHKKNKYKDKQADTLIDRLIDRGRWIDRSTDIHGKCMNKQIENQIQSDKRYTQINGGGGGSRLIHQPVNSDLPHIM